MKPRKRDIIRETRLNERLLYRRDPELRDGELPLDVQLRLKAAARVGEPGSIERQKAINAVYLWAESTYPQYFHQGARQ